MVYRANLSSYEGRAEPGLVAVKTLKGTLLITYSLILRLSFLKFLLCLLKHK